MLSRQALGRAAKPLITGAAPAGARNMATLREIEMRLKSVRNIEKITKVCSFTTLEACWRSPLLNVTMSTVDEGYCLHKTQQGAARPRRRQAVRHCQLWCAYTGLASSVRF